MEELQTGVYAIVNRADNKVYIGGAYRSFDGRWYQHVYDLVNNRHRARYLQRAWNKYGAEMFTFVVLERCAPEDVEAAEQRWLDQVQPFAPDCGYNSCPTVHTMLGYRHTDETKRKLSEKGKGRVRSLEERLRISETASKPRRGRLKKDGTPATYGRGKIMSDEARANISAGIREHWRKRRGEYTPQEEALSALQRFNLTDLAKLQQLLEGGG